MPPADRIEWAIESGKYELAKRLLTIQMREAEAHRDDVRLAKCHTVLGNIAEIERRLGSAFRNWSQALWYYERANVACSADTERIHDLIARWLKLQPVFVSYARSDGEIVAKTLRFARRSGVRFAIDREFLAGHSISEQIGRAVDRCPKFLVFYSRAYAQRSWTTFELRLIFEKCSKDRCAHAKDCCVIFFCIDDSLNSSGPIEAFRDVVWIDATASWSEACHQLVRALTISALD